MVKSRRVHYSMPGQELSASPEPQSSAAGKGIGSTERLFFFASQDSTQHAKREVSYFSPDLLTPPTPHLHPSSLCSSSQETAGARTPGWAASWKTRGKDPCYADEGDNYNQTKKNPVTQNTCKTLLSSLRRHDHRPCFSRRVP